MKLFCLTCGYNLSSSPVGAKQVVHCPECGSSGTVTVLRAFNDSQRFETGELLAKLMLWPGAIFAASCIPILSLFLAPFVGVAGLIGSAVISLRLADRLTWSRAVDAEGDANPRDLRMRAGLFCGFWFAQILISLFAVFGGCMIALGILSLTGNL